MRKPNASKPKHTPTIDKLADPKLQETIMRYVDERLAEQDKRAYDYVHPDYIPKTVVSVDNNLQNLDVIGVAAVEATLLSVDKLEQLCSLLVGDVPKHEVEPANEAVVWGLIGGVVNNYNTISYNSARITQLINFIRERL